MARLGWLALAALLMALVAASRAAEQKDMDMGALLGMLGGMAKAANPDGPKRPPALTCPEGQIAMQKLDRPLESNGCSKPEGIEVKGEEGAVSLGGSCSLQASVCLTFRVGSTGMCISRHRFHLLLRPPRRVLRHMRHQQTIL
jgi:hypothetical protein